MPLVISLFQSPNSSLLFQTGLNDNIFHAILNRDNCSVLSYWDFYKVKNVEFYSRLNDDERKEEIKYQSELEYNLMAKVKRRSDLKNSEMIAVLSVMNVFDFLNDV